MSAVIAVIEHLRAPTKAQRPISLSIIIHWFLIASDQSQHFIRIAPSAAAPNIEASLNRSHHKLPCRLPAELIVLTSFKAIYLEIIAWFNSCWHSISRCLVIFDALWRGGWSHSAIATAASQADKNSLCLFCSAAMGAFQGLKSRPDAFCSRSYFSSCCWSALSQHGK